MGLERRRVVVIGAGFGGLAGAIRLRAMGHPVTLLEARSKPGGRAGVVRRDDHLFDTGPTVITAPHLFEELFELVGRRLDDYVEVVPVDPFYRVTFPDGRHFDYVGDRQRLLDQIAQFNPDDVDGYRRLEEHAARIFEIGYQKLADQPFDSPWAMMRIVPAMVRLESFRSVYGLVAKYIDDPQLRQVFSFQPLLVGGNPFTVTSIYLLIHWLERKWGVHFARGGTAALVTSLVELIEEIGVDLRLATPADAIEVGPRGTRAVVTDSGERIPCRFVVSNADPCHTYTALIDPGHRTPSMNRKVERIDQSMGLFVGFFGTDRVYDDIPHHTIAMGPRYRGLLDDIFDRKVLADDFSAYLHRPTATDPTLAPPGCDTFYVLVPVPNNESGIDWASVGDAYFERILAMLERRHLPGLQEAITTRFWRGPDYFERSLRSVAGAGFGPQPTLGQSAWFRFHNRCSDVDGLYFVGAGTHPGAGVPGVLNSAKVVERLVPRPLPGTRNFTSLSPRPQETT